MRLCFNIRQVNQKNFASKAKIIFVNNSINELKRAEKQFGKRLFKVHGDCLHFINNISKAKLLSKEKNVGEKIKKKIKWIKLLTMY